VQTEQRAHYLSISSAFVPGPRGVKLKYALGVDILRSEEPRTVLDGCDQETTVLGNGDAADHFMKLWLADRPIGPGERCALQENVRLGWGKGTFCASVRSDLCSEPAHNRQNRQWNLSYARARRLDAGESPEPQ